MRIHLPFIILLLLPCFATQAQIFRVVTPDGRVIYTDSPPEGAEAEEVDLPELIIEPATEVRSPPASSPGAADQPQSAQPLPKPTISRPTEQQVVPPGQRQVSIVAEVSEQLPAGFSYILLVNGSVQGSSVTSPVWTLDSLNPGQQRVQVAIIDEQGSRRVLSEVRTFYVIR